ncbi:MAG TPA: DEAD/DEAH box helicase [Candidatus Kryptonia bacterium]
MLREILKKLFGRSKTPKENKAVEQRPKSEPGPVRQTESRPVQTGQQGARQEGRREQRVGEERDHAHDRKNFQGGRPKYERQQRPGGQNRPPRSTGKEQGGAARQAGQAAVSFKDDHARWDPSSYAVPPSEGKVRFHDFDLPSEVMHAIADLGFQYCTPIQAGILPKLLAGLDAAGRAQTGTGKTAAFLIAILNYLLRNPRPQPGRKSPRVLILAPTRELAMQIKKDADGLKKYTGLKVLEVLGGIDYKEQRELLSADDIDIVVATPGRLLDFKKQGNVHLDKVEILVIDEADRMLDMGFIPDVRRIIESTPPKNKRQTVLFSATLTPEINRLASRWTREHELVEIEPESVVVKTIKQIFYLTTDLEKFKILYNLIMVRGLQRVLVFANRKDIARDLKDYLSAYGISCTLMSGDVEQTRRIKRLEDFREGKIKVLVATDVAARGLHVEGISHVVNYTLPENPEDYVHRIGRTGRAGAEGVSISFASETDAYFVPAIKQFLGEDIPSIYPEDDLLTPLPEPKSPLPSRKDIHRKRFSGNRGYGRDRGGGHDHRRPRGRQSHS